MLYLTRNEEDFITFHASKESAGEQRVYEIDAIPVGVGFPKLNENGTIYFVEVEVPVPPPIPEPPKPVDPNELQKQILVNTEYLILLGELGGM